MRSARFLLFWLLFFAHAKAAHSAYPNKRIVVTDVLDDDLRAIIRLMLDPRTTKDSISGFVVSTGNTALKAEVLRKTLSILGYPDIPVYQGTSTDLAANNVTGFAGNFAEEGKHILPEAERLKLLKDKSSGPAGKMITEILKKESGRVDFLLLTAPTDVVKAVDQDPELFRSKAGDLISMGLYKEVKGAAGPRFVAPYNTMADPFSVRELFKLQQEGMFQNHYHVPSDTIQLRSGLPGGYFPGGEQGSAMKRKLAEIMEKNPGLRAILTAAKEYGHNWRDFATRTIGLGLQDYDRWVPSSFANPDEAAGFYLADTVPTALANLTSDELAKLDFQERFVATPEIKDVTKPFEFKVGTTGAGARVKDLRSFDGESELKSYFERLDTWVAKNGSGGLSPTVTKAASQFAPKLAKAFESDGRPRALVMTFKNSPDDWIALLQTVSTPEGREALSRGGVVAEGFETAEMAQALRAVLAEIGAKDVPVAIGHTYQPGEVDAIPNFAGERALYREKQGFAAFADVIAKHKAEIEKTPPFTAEQMLERARSWVTRNDGRIDLVVLGEGADCIKTITENKAAYAGRVGNVYLMGGGRLDPSGKFVLSRNWAREKEAGLQRLVDLGQLNEGRIFVFSSDQFGGSLVARGEMNPELIKNGGAASLASALDRVGEKSPAARALQKHWENWSRVFSQLGNLQKGIPFDPNAPVNTLTTSPLAPHIEDAWEYNRGENPASRWTILAIDPARVAAASSFLKPDQGVTWLLNQNNSVRSLAEKFSRNLDAIPKGVGSVVASAGIPRLISPHALFSADGKARALVLTFKNSPDDWFALLQAIATPQGREALRRGGIVTEGFETNQMARAVQAVLADLGLRDVPVAIGHSYQPGEVDTIPNFAGERVLYKENQGFAAFADLIEKHRGELDAHPPVSVNRLLEDARSWSAQAGGRIDLVVLGEGLDVTKAITENKDAYAKLLGNVYVMGGGRTDDKGKFVVTRNWAREKEAALARLKTISSMNDGRVLIFSSDQFGGSLVARGEAKAEQVATGNAVQIAEALDRAAKGSDAVKAISKHWENWSRVFAQLGGILKGSAFNPAQEVPVLTISPLAMHIEDAWQHGRADFPLASWRSLVIDPVQVVAEGNFPTVNTTVRWISNKNPSVKKIASRVAATLGNLKLDESAQRYHDAVRESGPFTPRAEILREALAAGKACESGYKALETGPKPPEGL